MISERMQYAVNEQINAELYSSYLYLSMASYFDHAGLKGFSNWMNVQAQEELFHAIKFRNYIHERGGKVLLKPIAGPPSEWKSPLDAFKEVATHESKVTSLINNLADLAIELKDHATGNFLLWYINEQVEEEASAADVISRLKLIGENTSGLFMLDNELGARVFTMPAASAQN